jgi:hypothetical protein
MAILSKITVSRMVRVNTGNYEGTEISAELEFTLDELDDENQVLEQADQMVNAAMLASLERLYFRRKKKVTRQDIIKAHGLGV